MPTSLVQVANAPGGRYRLSAAVRFNHRGDQLTDRVEAHLSVRYDISYDTTRRRWYLDASWGSGDVWKPPALEVLQGLRTLAVDLNDGHLAAIVVDQAGNPVGRPQTVETDLAGLPTATRDGRLRAAISTLIRLATSAGCASVTIENLNFAEARAIGRETMGRGRRGKRFRRTVAGLPTGRFRDRLVNMCANAHLAVIAVDPAYTSRWGGQYWQPHLTPAVTTRITDGDLSSSASGPASRHHGAAVVIGRRGLGHRARRRTGTPTTDQHKRIGTRPKADVRVTAVLTGLESDTSTTPLLSGVDPPRCHLGDVTRAGPNRTEQGKGCGNRSHTPKDTDVNTYAQSF